jgi:peptidoglycan-associated lipoprotein
MPVKAWDTTISTLILSVVMLVLVSGCGKKVTSSSGDTSAERVKPEPIASVPQTGGATAPGTFGGPGGMDAGRTVPGGQAPSGQTPGGQDRMGLANSGTPNMSGTGTATDLQDIYFDYDRFTVRADGVQSMEQNAKWLRSHKGQTMIIEGHADERGTAAYNLVLGEKRARSAKRYLEDLGISGAQIQITSFGENRPFCNDQTESCYQKNRRAHFVTK